MSDEAPQAEDLYGLSIWDQLALLQQYAPLLSFGQRIVTEPDNYKKTIIVADALEWLSAKTQTKFDDEAVKLVGDVVKTREFETLVRWILEKAGVK